MFGSAAPQASPLGNSQQLRSEFTFLLRAVDGAASQAARLTNGNQRRRVGKNSMSLFTYALEISLTLARFDVHLTLEERKLLVRACDHLVVDMLRAIKEVDDEARQLDEIAAYFRELKERFALLNVLDWEGLAARACCTAGTSSSPSDGEPPSNPPRDERDPANVFTDVGVDLATLYTNVVVAGSIEALQGTHSATTDSNLSGSGATALALSSSSPLASPAVPFRPSDQRFNNKTYCLKANVDSTTPLTPAREPGTGKSESQRLRATFASDLRLSAESCQLLKRLFLPESDRTISTVVWPSSADETGGHFALVARRIGLRHDVSFRSVVDVQGAPFLSASMEGTGVAVTVAGMGVATPSDSASLVGASFQSDMGAIPPVKRPSELRTRRATPDDLKFPMGRESAIAEKKKKDTRRAYPPPALDRKDDALYAVTEQLITATLVKTDRRLSEQLTREASREAVMSATPLVHFSISESPSMRSILSDSAIFSTSVPATFGAGSDGTGTAAACNCSALIAAADAALDAVDASHMFLRSCRSQIRAELALLCFRIVSTVIDLLLPASECKGKAAPLFYRKLLCDIYRVLLETNLLRQFSSLVHRARQTGVADGVTAAGGAPASTPMAYTSGLGPRSSFLDSPRVPPAHLVLPDSSHTFIRTPRVSRTRFCASGEGVDDLNVSCGDRQESDDEAICCDAKLSDFDDADDDTAVGALFRTFRHEGHSSETAAAIPSHPRSIAFGAAAPESGYAATTLFRSLHGNDAAPPRGLFGTRLMFTLLNGTDVSSTDLQQDDHASPSSSIQVSPSLVSTAHHRTTSNGSDTAPSSVRPRGNSLPVVLNSGGGGACATPPKSSHHLLYNLGTTPTSTATLIAMPHHHRFRYPIVRNATDVKHLYMALCSDAEMVLSVHDPLRAAIVMNASDFLATQDKSHAAALQLIDDYLLDVAVEPISIPLIRGADITTSAGAAPAALPVGIPTPAAHSGFSVTSVRRAISGSNTPGQVRDQQRPPSPPLGTVPSNPTPLSKEAHCTSLPDRIASWNTADEQQQFAELVSLLKTAKSALEKKIEEAAGEKAHH